MNAEREPPRIAGPVAQPKKPRVMPPPGAWDSHAHVFGPADKFPYAPGRGYTPPDAPVEKYLALLDWLGCARGLVVQGNAHGYDNRVVLDAIMRFPQRLRGIAITDTRVKPETLRRSCEASSDSLLIALDVALVDSVVFALISRKTCVFLVMALATLVCSFDEPEMFWTRLAI